MKLSEMGKDMKIKQSPLPLQSMGNFFRKKALHGGTNVFGLIDGGTFRIVANAQITQGGEGGGEKLTLQIGDCI